MDQSADISVSNWAGTNAFTFGPTVSIVGVVQVYDITSQQLGETPSFLLVSKLRIYTDIWDVVSSHRA